LLAFTDDSGLTSNAKCQVPQGSKILLEKSINIRASDYKFQDKNRYYNGYTDVKGKEHPASMVAEYRELTKKMISPK
jgi:hypothetical protein